MSLFIPSEDLTCHNYGEEKYKDLSDRQLFAWAYKTETKIRFEKFQSREEASSGSIIAANKYSTTLRSEYLIDVYPTVVEGNTKLVFETVLERDRCAFARKAHPSLLARKIPDGSLTPIELLGEDAEKQNKTSREFMPALERGPPVPPNFLYFEILLEGYTGYKWSSFFNSQDPTLPRGVIMGGAVVAALTAWQDSRIRNMLEEMEQYLSPEQRSASRTSRKRTAKGEKKQQKAPGKEPYHAAKEILVNRVNDFFLANGTDIDDGPNVYLNLVRGGVNQAQFLPNNRDKAGKSPFCDGDVDVFLQTSPQMRSFLGMLETRGLSPDILHRIQGFLGGVGLCHEELRLYSHKVLKNLKDQGTDDNEHGEKPDFVHALTKNGLSFMSAPYADSHSPYARSYFDDIEPWPRPTQLIMLDPKADLLGALMDFDLSVATCAFDGTSVRITPRAALSLQRSILAVTPFCFEEKRNRKRIVKYQKRGFDPVLIDPNCGHKELGSSLEPLIKMASPNVDEERLLAGGHYRCDSFRSPEEYEDILEVQDEDRKLKKFCCCDREDHHGPYTMALFEKSQGDATEFFRQLYNCDNDRYQEVLRVPTHCRLACKPCRENYGLCRFVDGEFPVDPSEDVLRAEKSLKFGPGYKGMLQPSFYGGSVFDSTRVKSEARDYNQARALLHAQAKAEKFRYMLKHNNSLKGYQPRFTYTAPVRWDDEEYFDPLDRVFEEGAKLALPSSGRAPVGLNPERFIAKCEDCKDWLHGAEFGTKFCQKCQDSKPAAR